MTVYGSKTMSLIACLLVPNNKIFNVLRLRYLMSKLFKIPSLH